MNTNPTPTVTRTINAKGAATIHVTGTGGEDWTQSGKAAGSAAVLIFCRWAGETAWTCYGLRSDAAKAEAEAANLTRPTARRVNPPAEAFTVPVLAVPLPGPSAVVADYLGSLLR